MSNPQSSSLNSQAILQLEGRGLPLRGQRTRTNARTRKGPRKTVAGKKKSVSKT